MGSFEPVDVATMEWVDWFNRRRRVKSIGNISPAEAEARAYVRLEQRATGSDSNRMPAEKWGTVHTESRIPLAS